ncbi:Corytuberine synthase [Linum grandiflorum]
MTYFEESLLKIVLPLLLLCFLLRNYWRRERKQEVRRKLPPGPKPWPILGNLLHVGSKLHVDFARLAEIHGPIVSLRFGNMIVAVCSTPEAAGEILKVHDYDLSGRFVPDVSFARDPDLNRDSIAWSVHCSDTWRAMRSMVRTELFSARAVEGQSSIREKRAEEIVGFLKRQRGTEVRIRDVVFAYTFNSLANTYMSTNLVVLEGEDKNVERVSRIVRDMMELHGALNISDLYPALSFLDLQGLRKKTNECVRNLREMRVEARGMNNANDSPTRSTRDFLDVLIESNFSIDQISYMFVKKKSICVCMQELLAAVSDTTSATMEWAMAELLKNPKTIATARRELESKFATMSNHTVKESDLADLPYICSCVKETLRLHPPAPLLLPRRAAKDCQVMNYTIPKGSQVFVNVWAIARDPHYWEDPSQFNPERFLKGSINDEVDYKGNHFEYLPFGSGRRICSGMSMAMRKVQLVVATLVHEFDWSLPMGMVAEDLDMDEGYGVTLIKANPLVAIPTPRS